MRKKVLDYLQNFLMRYKDHIADDDVFIPMECSEAENKLTELICKLPKHLIPKTGLDSSVLEHFPKNLRDQLREQMEDNSLHCTVGSLWNKSALQKAIREMIPELIAAAKASIIPEEEDIFQARVQELQKTLKLSDREIDILLVSLAVNGNMITDPRSGNYRGGRGGQRLFMMTNCLNTTESDILKSVGENNSLRKYNCLDDDLDITSEICSFLSGMNDEPLVNSFFKKDIEAVLPWSDFATLVNKHGNILKRMLASSHPVNILLYGAPGTGKTSFARALASEAGKTCFRISQNTSERGNKTSSSPAFRFAALQFCDSQVEPQSSLIVVDEADDMLKGRNMGFFFLFGADEETTGDKGLLNTVLDTMKTSTIWITNTPAKALDSSSRRRFDYSICFEPLNSEQRKRIWKNNIARLNMGRLFTGKMLECFSTMYPVSAGGISQTLENLQKLDPRRKEIPGLVEQLMKPHCELLGIKLADDKLLPSKDYSLEGLNIRGDVQLDRIVEAIRTFQRQKPGQDADRPRMNLLLSGPPGTGKTEFVKYLGSVLNTKISVKMGSDLLSMWVGGTERNIKQAFAEAEAEHAILFLDELDGLVQTRTNARYSWEVTQVNELLYQMENFKGVMIGATNFIQNLDQAIMRRFTFKLEFNFLDNAGKKLFFERMFHTSLSEEETRRLKVIPSLAPGDFRTVRQSLYYYGGEVTNAMRLDALERESDVKASVPSGNVVKSVFEI